MRPNVLIVDDEPLAARAMERSLPGYSVQVASTGEDAVRRITAAPPDVIVCDVNLPDMTGEDVLHRVMEFDPTLGRRFLFVTGGASEDIAERLGLTHGDAMLEKPLSPAELRTHVEAVRTRSL